VRVGDCVESNTTLCGHPVSFCQGARIPSAERLVWPRGVFCREPCATPQNHAQREGSRWSSSRAPRAAGIFRRHPDRLSASSGNFFRRHSVNMTDSSGNFPRRCPPSGQLPRKISVLQAALPARLRSPRRALPRSPDGGPLAGWDLAAKRDVHHLLVNIGVFSQMAT
jgi:hypothetical protein